MCFIISSLNQNENIVSFVTMPPMVKPFSPRKARNHPYSTNPVTARTREICQSRSGWGAERARIIVQGKHAPMLPYAKVPNGPDFLKKNVQKPKQGLLMKLSQNGNQS